MPWLCIYNADARGFYIVADLPIQPGVIHPVVTLQETKTGGQTRWMEMYYQMHRTDWTVASESLRRDRETEGVVSRTDPSVTIICDIASFFHKPKWYPQVIVNLWLLFIIKPLEGIC